MRIAELSRHTGVPVPTIKYYLREGLLPPGEFTSPNQAFYNDRHVQRLRLVRALVDVGRLPIATIKDLIADIDSAEPDLHHMLGRALKSVTDVNEPASDPALRAAELEVDDLIARRDWHVGAYTPARRIVAEAMSALRQLGAGPTADRIDGFAEAAERIAALDLELVAAHADEPEAMVQIAVVGTIIGDSLVAGLRRLAQESASAKMFGHICTEPPVDHGAGDATHRSPRP